MRHVSSPLPRGVRGKRDESGIPETMDGYVLPVAGESPPAHWLLWSYYWRYGLCAALAFGTLGMYMGWMDSIGNLSEMLTQTAMFALVFAVFSQFFAFIIALVVHVATASSRRAWSAHRSAGWTTTQCRAEYGGQKAEARALKLDARLRELGLDTARHQGEGPGVRRDATGCRIPYRSRTQKVIRGLIFRTILAVVVAASLVVGLGGTIMLGYDKNHHVPIECTVVSAYGFKTASGGGRGSASYPMVRVRLPTAGRLL